METIMYDVVRIREDFPILQQKIHGKPLTYFDNAATTQKPIQVLEAIQNYYTSMNANIHRGLHSLADKATAAYESTRMSVKNFIHAPHENQIIFTRGVTESINLVAQCYGGLVLQKGDIVLISTMEHHSNIVPWQMICESKGAKLCVIPINSNGEIIWEAYEKMLNEKVKIVSIVHVSNALGTINPVKEMIRLAHSYGAVVLVDGAQAASHLNIDVQDLEADFYTLSAHKFYGPTGIGALYGKKELLEAMPPYMGGGEMISEVTFDKTTYNVLPYKFEAGTPNIADTVALKAAIDYLDQIGKPLISAHENELLNYLQEQLSTIKGIRLYGAATQKVSVQSFLIDGIHPQDTGIILDSEGVAVRTGHHCTQPLMAHFKIPGTVRVSLAMYNTFEEIDVLIKAILKAKKMLL